MTRAVYLACFFMLPKLNLCVFLLPPDSGAAGGLCLSPLCSVIKAETHKDAIKIRLHWGLKWRQNPPTPLFIFYKIRSCTILTWILLQNKTTEVIRGLSWLLQLVFVSPDSPAKPRNGWTSISVVSDNSIQQKVDFLWSEAVKMFGIVPLHSLFKNNQSQWPQWT